MADTAPEHEYGRLTWRCRRGMKELDLLLLDYLRGSWAAASPAERHAFKRILDLPDPQLAAYLLGNEQCTDDSLAPLLAKLQGLARQGRPAPAGEAGSGA